VRTDQSTGPQRTLDKFQLMMTALIVETTMINIVA
jgi:hypothetical protein